MKEKILAQLKLACGEKTSVSDRTLEKLAATLSLGVTDEAAIPALIEAQKSFLQELDGNISFVAAKAVKEHAIQDDAAAQAAAAKKAADDAAVKKSTEGEPSWFAEWKAKQEKETADIKLQLDTKAKAEASAALVSKAKEGFLSKYKVSDAEKSLFEKAVAIELVTNPTHADEESMITGFKSQYEGLRSVIGLPGLETQAPANNNGKSSTPLLDKVKADLQNSGKLPQKTT